MQVFDAFRTRRVGAFPANSKPICRVRLVVLGDGLTGQVPQPQLCSCEVNRDSVTGRLIVLWQGAGGKR